MTTHKIYLLFPVLLQEMARSSLLLCARLKCERYAGYFAIVYVTLNSVKKGLETKARKPGGNR